MPLPIAEMLTSASADDAMARALIERGNPAIEAVRTKDREKAMQQGLQEGRNQGLQEGRDQGLHEGRTRGLQEGRDEGLVRGKCGALLFVLAERGILISMLDRQRILAETDVARLDRWIACAVRCTDIAEVLAVA